MNAATEIKLIDDISEANAPAIYVKGGLQQFLEAVKAEVAVEVPDLTTRKGRDRIASLAAKVSKSKVAVERPGREYLARLKEMPKVVEAELREFVRAMDTLRDETRKPLTEWEEAEKCRIAAHEDRLQMLRELSQESPSYEAGYLELKIAEVMAIAIDQEWEEFEAEAARVKDSTLQSLREALAIRQKHDAEQAELARLRAEASAREQQEREQRIAQEAAERAQREAEAKAQAEREAAAQRERDAQLAAERRELELKLQAEQAEREKLAAQQRAEQAERDAQARAEQAAAAERQRQADEQARADAETKAREADKAHRTAVNRAALEAFVAAGMPEECAKQAIILIAKRQIPNISITY